MKPLLVVVPMSSMFAIGAVQLLPTVCCFENIGEENNCLPKLERLAEVGRAEGTEVQNVENVQFELRKGNVFQLAHDSSYSSTTWNGSRNNDDKVLAVVERQPKSSNSSVSAQASTPRKMTPEPVLNERIPQEPQEITIYGIGAWEDDMVYAEVDEEED
jgi:hypothetical protein